jgi:retron-type reverse transcriptase
MYISLRRRGGYKRLADVHDRRVPAEAHKGSCRDFLRRHERESVIAADGTRRQRADIAKCLFRRAADSRNLRCAINYVASQGGEGPGPNGLKFENLDHQQRCELANVLGKALSMGTYRPGPDREVEIPKSSGKGTRTLKLQDIEDRVVQRAIVQVIQPVIDPGFAVTSFGYRPRLGTEHALATAEFLACSKNSWTWVTDDIRDAFDHVPHGRLLDIVQNRLQSGEMADLIRVVIENEKGQGLRQGGSLSPFLLNLYLDHLLDRPWKKSQPETPLLRYADDLLILTANGDRADEAHAHLRHRLQAAGMSLKGTPGTANYDLQTGDTVQWIGFAIRKGPEGMEYRPTERNWYRLREHLEMCHTKPGAPIRAIDTIVGWLEHLGPCAPFLDATATQARIVTLASELAFEEVPSLERVSLLMEHAHRGWTTIKGKIPARLLGNNNHGGSA